MSGFCEGQVNFFYTLLNNLRSLWVGAGSEAWTQDLPALRLMVYLY